jgi:hypothetical protein
LSLKAGDREYELVPDWGQLPEEWIWGIVAAVSVDSEDNVHAFTRTDHPCMVFDKSGKLLHHWGRGIFEDAHGVSIDAEGNSFWVDRNLQMVMKFNKAGQHQFTLGNRGVHSETGYTEENPHVTHAAGPFHHPTNVGFGVNGAFYVSDGYRNSRVHKYAADGTLLFSWGEPGHGPGQFELVHGVWQHKGLVYVADRVNNRIQIFDLDGKYLREWGGYDLPCNVFIDANDIVYVAELNARVTVADLDGNVLDRWGGERSPMFPANSGRRTASGPTPRTASTSPRCYRAPACRNSPALSKAGGRLRRTAYPVPRPRRFRRPRG